MARKPTEYVQLKLRVRESLRRKLERAAEKKAHSANAEAVARIEYTFADEEEWEARAKEMEERRDEIDQQHREWLEEEAKREAEHQTALRDSRLLTFMVGSDDNVTLVRAIMHLINEHPDWNKDAEERIRLGLKIQEFLTHANDVFQGQIK
ncbi:hypothetical protein [Bradyrhizobium sp. sBnM-33]|uniref:hypothetical protein n=1 Tax=Bradyrhizobium sp. sBnM-33 TaxID=2831780 RepID=UPI001BCBA457|nr:hypothetical protein [Bradyrhizobium sp. sBnM-33]WOH47657.1 hypothetical protein RX328_26185 [Bradyrhizobium sp. sBnM-33]